MTDVLRKTFLIIIVLFLLFYLLTAPVQFANFLESIGDVLSEFFHSLIRFFHALGN